MMKTIMAVANAHTAFHYTPAARIVTTAATHLRTAATVTLRQVLTADATSASDMLLSARNVQSYSSGNGGGAAVVAAATMIVTSARKAREEVLHCTCQFHVLINHIADYSRRGRRRWRACPAATSSSCRTTKRS